MVIVLVLDGLRPDAITERDMPTLARLRREGVSFASTHAAIPTVTRVNAAAIATGTFPERNGLTSNALWAPAVDSVALLATSDSRALLRLDSTQRGGLLFVPTLAERLRKLGISYVAVSSGSTGNALISDVRAPSGGGVLIDGGFDGGARVAYPDSVSAAVLARFGRAPTDSSAGSLTMLLDWTERIIREYVVPVQQPRVLFDWMTEPDESQHLFGPGSPEARAALRAVDRNIGLLLQAVAARGLAGRTDVLVLSDHGFATSGTEVAVVDSLVNAGFKASRTSTDVVVDNEAQSVLLHVRGHDPAKIVRIAHYLQRRSWADVVFTAGAANSTQGDVPGTFALGVIDEQSTARGPDLMVTLPWTNDTNRYGVVGAQSIAASGPPVAEGVRGSHGGLSPYVIHNTLIAWGPDFARGAVDSAPVGNVDMAPTVLARSGGP